MAPVTVIGTQSGKVILLEQTPAGVNVEVMATPEVDSIHGERVLSNIMPDQHLQSLPSAIAYFQEEWGFQKQSLCDIHKLDALAAATLDLIEHQRHAHAS